MEHPRQRQWNTGQGRRLRTFLNDFSRKDASLGSCSTATQPRHSTRPPADDAAAPSCAWPCCHEGKAMVETEESQKKDRRKPAFPCGFTKDWLRCRSNRDRRKPGLPQRPHLRGRDRDKEVREVVRIVVPGLDIRTGQR